MSFSTMIFLFRFLPIFLLIYFVVSAEYRNLVLLLGSLVFYAYGEPLWILLLLVSIGINYTLARDIYREHMKEKKSGLDRRYERKRYLIFSILFNIEVLLLFKYLTPVVNLLGVRLGLPALVEWKMGLPMGISFYTFQVLAFVIEVYQGKVPVKRGSLLEVATYVTMFPKLIQGPITNYSEVRGALKERQVNLNQIEYGVTLFVVGLSFKVLLADKIGGLWSDVQTIGAYGINTITAWLGSWGFSMQLLFDWVGYSLMAVGLGHILGFVLPDNFDDPYACKSATDFWRKWHITLGRWFRDYVYIPLGGNRKGKGRMVFNTLIVWVLTGIWHGSTLNFILWGLLFFVLLTIEKLGPLKFLQKSHVVGRLYMLIIIPFSWTIFAITNLKDLMSYLKVMFFIPLEGAVTVNSMQRFWALLSKYWWMLLLCAVFCTPWPMRLLKKYYKTWPVRIILLALFWYSVFQISKYGTGAFLYAGF